MFLFIWTQINYKFIIKNFYFTGGDGKLSENISENFNKFRIRYQTKLEHVKMFSEIVKLYQNYDYLSFVATTVYSKIGKKIRDKNVLNNTVNNILNQILNESSVSFEKPLFEKSDVPNEIKEIIKNQDINLSSKLQDHFSDLLRKTIDEKMKRLFSSLTEGIYFINKLDKKGRKSGKKITIEVKNGKIEDTAENIYEMYTNNILEFDEQSIYDEIITYFFSLPSGYEYNIFDSKSIMSNYFTPFLI